MTPQDKYALYGMYLADCYGMLSTGRPNPYYHEIQQNYGGVNYISPYSTPDVIGQYKPFVELNRHGASNGFGCHSAEEMAKKIRGYQVNNHNNYMRSKM